MVSVSSINILMLLSCVSAHDIIGYDGKEAYRQPHAESGTQPLKDNVPDTRALAHLRESKPKLTRMVNARLTDDARGALKFEKVGKLEVDLKNPEAGKSKSELSKVVAKKTYPAENMLRGMLSVVALPAVLPAATEPAQEELEVKRTVNTKGARPLKDLLPFLPDKYQLNGGGKEMDDIAMFRAEICAQMKEEHKEDFDNLEDCVKFMRRACKPGKDERMDGDKGEVTSGKGYCQKFFPPNGEAHDDSDADAGEDDDGSDDKDDSDDSSDGADDDSADSDDGVAAAPSPALGAATPGGAPAGPDAVEKASSKDTARNLAEAKIVADGGHRMHEEVPLQEQGFMGELVTHDDKASALTDWQREFGPMGLGDKNFRSICGKYTNNEWCRVNGYYSDASIIKSSMLTILLSAIVALA